MIAVGWPPLLITRQRLLVEEVLKVVRPLRLPLETTPVPPAAQDWYLSAPLVMIGADILPALARCPPRPRPHLIVVSAELDNGLLTAAADVIPEGFIALLPPSAAWLADQLTAVCAPGGASSPS